MTTGLDQTQLDQERFKFTVQNQFDLGGHHFEGFFTPQSIQAVHELETRDDDVFMMSYPRSGSTWTKNMLMAIRDGSEKVSKMGHKEINQQFPYLEGILLENTEHCGFTEYAQEMPSPRFLKSHLPVNLAIKQVFSHNRKVVMVLRNPKDVALSQYRFYMIRFTLQKFRPDNLNEFLDKFLDGQVSFGSWWDHTLGWLKEARKHSNFLPIFYEDLSNDFATQAKRVATFLGKECTDVELRRIAGICQIGNMKERYESQPGIEKDFVRTGGTGGWKKTFSEYYARKFDEKTRETFKDDEFLDRFI